MWGRVWDNMLRKTLTILSLIGLLLSVGLWLALPPSTPSSRPFAKVCTLGNTHIVLMSGPFMPRSVSMQSTTYLIIPFWMPLLLFASWLTYVSIRTVRKPSRRRKGLCSRCGYDLRGSKERCPECGTGFSS